jgi:hypothetical protein
VLFRIPVNYVFVSSDFGATWTSSAQSPFTQWRGVACSGNGMYVAAYTNNTNGVAPLYISSDFGASFVAAVSPSSGVLVYADVVFSSSGQYLTAVGNQSMCIYCCSIMHFVVVRAD